MPMPPLSRPAIAAVRLPRILWPLAAALALGVLSGPVGSTSDLDPYRAGMARFIAEMVDKHGFSPEGIAAILNGAAYRQDIIDTMERPYEGKPWHRYRPLFVTPERIERGVEYWREHAALLDRASAVYGIDPAIVVAIVGVETNYGRHVGKHRVLDALTTLGFAYPPRAEFFRKQLEEFLLLSREEAVDPLTAVGSYAGALGQPQFIPSSYRAYSVDFDGDGRRDLWTSHADVIGSVANYFRQHGWLTGQPVALPASLVAPLPAAIPVAERRPLAPATPLGELLGSVDDWRPGLTPGTLATLIRLDGNTDEYWVSLTNFYVITRYNHSNLYAMAVHQLSEAIRARVRPLHASDAPDASQT